MEGTPQTPAEIEALEEILTGRGEDTQQIKQQTLRGDEVAPTPKTGIQGSAPRLVPAAPGSGFPPAPEQFRMDGQTGLKDEWQPDSNGISVWSKSC